MLVSVLCAVFASKGYPFKDIDNCQIEIIKGLTDKGQFQYLTKLMGIKRGLTCIQHNFIHYDKDQYSIIYT